MAVVVLAVAVPAADFGGGVVDDGDDRMVGDPFALDTEIVDIVTEAQFSKHKCALLF